VAPGIVLNTFFSVDATKKGFTTIGPNKIHRQHGINVDERCIAKRSDTKIIFSFLIDSFLSVRLSIQLHVP
jgi:hypothetical protein